MSDLVQHHMSRLRMATTNRLGRSDMARWICENTYINGKNYSFKDHEWQERLLAEESNEIVIIKSAQLGASEISLRMALALTMTSVGKFAMAYLFPTAEFSLNYAKTRFSPIVYGSPTLRAAMGTSDIDSAELKTFGSNKSIAFRGTTSGTSALSHSLDAVFWDEYSFMEDQQVALDYESRLIHSKYRIKVKLSTPTFHGDPISAAFENTKKWVNMCRCHHCGHSFYPSFYDHVRVPGWDNHLDEITTDNIRHVRVSDAALFCPSCGKIPSLQPTNREWVCQNPSENHVATGLRLSPFDVPNVITIPYLIKASTSYASKNRFRNFNLGMTSEDSETGITSQDLDAAGVQISQTPFTTHVMGIDLGLTSHFIVGNIDSEGRMGVTHMERVPLSKFRERYWALKSQYRIHVVVSDIQPYSDLILSLSNEDSNLFGASYVTRNGLELFDVRIKEDDPDHALLGVKQVHVNRNAAFDALLADFREGKVWVAQNHDWELFKAHLQDMKRAAATLRNGEFTSLWQKSAKGNDHYHHALLYFSIACKMRGVVNTTLVGGLSPVKKFRLKEKPLRNRA